MSTKTEPKKKRKLRRFTDAELVEKFPDDKILKAFGNNTLIVKEIPVKRLRTFAQSVNLRPKIINGDRDDLTNGIHEYIEHNKAHYVVSTANLVTSTWTCSVCLDIKTQMSVLNPCGHEFCSTCAQELKHCLKCEANIESVTRQRI